MTAFMTNLLMGVRLLRVTLRYWLSNIRSVLVETRAELDILGCRERERANILSTFNFPRGNHYEQFIIPYLEDS